MPMNFLQELVFNYKATYRLAPRYYRLTNTVGTVVAIVGFILVAGLGLALSTWLGISADVPFRTNANWLPFIVSFLLLAPLVGYAGVVLVAYLAALIFVRTGHLLKAEVKYYALRSRFPERWFAA